MAGPEGALTPWQRAQNNVQRHHRRLHENEILRERFFPSLGHYFDVAMEIREIRLRDAMIAWRAMSN
jgi:hypothetical protein